MVSRSSPFRVPRRTSADASSPRQRWVSPQTPTRVTPFEATQRQNAWVPTVTFGQLTHTPSPGAGIVVPRVHEAADPEIPHRIGGPSSRLFLLTNPDDYSLRYDGVI